MSSSTTTDGPAIRSLGYRTDLNLLRIQGSSVELADGALIIRTPDLPTFRWGNFLLLRDLPAAAELEYWQERFTAAFPGAKYLALGFDEPHCPAVPDPALDLSPDVVMTATDVPLAPHPNTEVQYRELRSDSDWNSLSALRVAIDGSASAGTREFLSGRVAAHRRLTREGTAIWLGAFDGDHLVASLGIAMAEEGTARYQNVGTHPDHRRRGLAASLVARAGELALAEFGARTLVIVAEAGSDAARIYQAAGFAPVEDQLGIERA